MKLNTKNLFPEAQIDDSQNERIRIFLPLIVKDFFITGRYYAGADYITEKNYNLRHAIFKLIYLLAQLYRKPSIIKPASYILTNKELEELQQDIDAFEYEEATTEPIYNKNVGYLDLRVYMIQQWAEDRVEVNSPDVIACR